MKKVFVILIALAATMVACNKVADVNDPMDSVKEIVFNMEVKQGDVQDTKAVKTDWENGDKVYVFFKGLVGTNKYAIFTYDGSSWTKNANGIEASDLSGLADKQLTAVYFPFGTPTFTANVDKYDVTADESYYLSFNGDYTSAVVDESLVLSATLNMTVPAGFVQFSMPQTDGTNIFFRETPVYTLTESHLAPVSVTSITPGSTALIHEVGSYGEPLKGYFYGEENARCILFSGILESAARNENTKYSFTFVNNMETVDTYDDVTYLFDVNATLYQDDGASWRALKFPVISSPSWKVPEPSGYVVVAGVKWGTRFVGASYDGGHGDFFSWGANYPQAKYEESDYHVESYHDVANEKMGDNWRMPTQGELDLLGDEIYKIFEGEGDRGGGYDDAGFGYEGFLIEKDKETISSSSYLYINFAGMWYNVLNSSGCDIWSSTSLPSHPGHASTLEIGSDYVYSGGYPNPVCFGQSILPVYIGE